MNTTHLHGIVDYKRDILIYKEGRNYVEPVTVINMSKSDCLPRIYNNMHLDRYIDVDNLDSYNLNIILYLKNNLKNTFDFNLSMSTGLAIDRSEGRLIPYGNSVAKSFAMKNMFVFEDPELLSILARNSTPTLVYTAIPTNGQFDYIGCKNPLYYTEKHCEYSLNRDYTLFDSHIIPEELELEFFVDKRTDILLEDDDLPINCNENKSYSDYTLLFVLPEIMEGIFITSFVSLVSSLNLIIVKTGDKFQHNVIRIKSYMPISDTDNRKLVLQSCLRDIINYCSEEMTEMSRGSLNSEYLRMTIDINKFYMTLQIDDMQKDEIMIRKKISIYDLINSMVVSKFRDYSISMEVSKINGVQQL